MKKGLVSPPQLAFGYTTCVQSELNIAGPELGPLIVQVEDPANIFNVGSPFYWVDVPDEAVAYQWYYNTSTLTAVSLAPATYYATASIADLGATLGDTILVSPATAAPPSDTTYQEPPSPAGGQLLYWYNDDWVASCFDPNVYTTVPAAKAYLNQQTNLVASDAVDFQSSMYSSVQLIQGDLSVLTAMNYPTYSLDAYQTFIDGQVASQEAVVNAATTLEQLYGFDPGTLNTNPGA